jgi:hypothetical protein
MFIFFLGIVWLSGKKISPLATAIISAGIVAANLLVPVGKVLAVIGPIKVTQTALMDGIGKALVLEGLVYISKATILPGLRLPGRFGALVASAFVYYERIAEFGGAIRPATLIEDVDALMLKVWEAPIAEGSAEARSRPRPLVSAALAAIVIAAYLPLLLFAHG